MKPAMKLTVRQKILLMKFLEYFRRTQKPVHYSALSIELGLSKITTYELLKLLEAQGYLRPVYVMSTGPGKRGRSKVMFLPTEKNMELVYQPFGGKDAKGEQLRKFLADFLRKANENELWEGFTKDMYDVLVTSSGEVPALAPRTEIQTAEEEWEELKEHILTTISRNRKSGYINLLYELIALTAVTSSPLARSLEVILAILLNIRAAKYKFEGPDPLRLLLDTPVSRERMIMLAGFAWGLLASNPKARRILSDVRTDIEVYEESINKLSQEELLKLHEFTREVWDHLSEQAKPSLS